MQLQKPNLPKLFQGLIHTPPEVVVVFKALCGVIVQMAARLCESDAVIREYEEAIQLSELRGRERIHGKLWD